MPERGRRRSARRRVRASAEARAIAFPVLELARAPEGWRITWANVPARRRLGASAGQRVDTLPRGIAGPLSDVVRCADDDGPTPADLVRLADGSVWCCAAVAPRGAEGHVQVALLPAGRITRRLALALDAAGIGSWTWDLASNTTTVDAQTRALFGYPPDVQPTQEMWLARVHPEDRERIRDLNARCLAGEVEWQAEYRIVRPDGSVRWLREATRREGPRNWVGLVMDVTNEIEAREILRRENAAALRRADDLGELIETMSDIVIRAAPDTTRLYVNAAYERILGRTRQEVLGTRYTDELPPEQAEALRRRLARLTPENRHNRAIADEVVVDGRRIWIEWHELGVFDKAGRLVEIRSVGRDLTDRVDAERRLADSERRLALALQGSGRGLWEWDVNSRALYLSGEAAAMLGLPPEPCSLEGDPLPRSTLNAEDAVSLAESLAPVLDGHRERFTIEQRARRLDGVEVWLELAGQVAGRDSQGRPARLLGLLGDVTLRRDEMARMAYLASHDPLTGLINRAAFDTEAALALARARRQRTSAAVMMIDLDGFKQINDRFGHGVGDDVLRHAARRLKQALRAADLLARVGGDEFVAFLDGVPHADELVGIGRRSLAALGTPPDGDVSIPPVSASIGIALARDGTADLSDLVRAADRALYEAKHAGRNRCRLVELS